MRLPFLVLLLAAACGDAPAPAPPQTPRRVVSLLPSFTEIVAGLGLADRLAACTEYCEPGRDLPHVPWQGAAATEAIVRLRPDLVLRQSRRRGDDALQATLERAGVPVLSLPSETTAQTRAAITAIADALGAPEKGRAFLARFDADLAAAKALAAGKPRPTVLFVTSRDAGVAANLGAAGAGSFLDELIRFAGGRNALADIDDPYATISLEEFVRRAPEVIIDNLPPEDDPMAAWARYASVPAVRDGRVHAVRDNGLLKPGPGLPASVRRLAEMIHGRP